LTYRWLRFALLAYSGEKGLLNVGRYGLNGFNGLNRYLTGKNVLKYMKAKTCRKNLVFCLEDYNEEF